MPKFTIYYVVKDWIEVDVNAENEEAARKAARKIIDHAGYKNTAISIVDGNTEFAGIALNDVVNEIN